MLWVSSQAAPTLTCLKHHLASMPSSESTEPLSKVHALETTGLEAAAETKHLMRSIETRVVTPLRALSERITIQAENIAATLNGICATPVDDCNRALNVSVTRLQSYARTTCTEMANLIGLHSERATDVALRMDQYAADVRDFGAELKLRWVPQFKKHRDGKVPTSLKVFGITSVLAVGGLVFGFPVTAPACAAYAVTTTAIGGVGSYITGKYETQWADDGQLVREIGNEISPYSSLIEVRIYNINIRSGVSCSHSYIPADSGGLNQQRGGRT